MKTFPLFISSSLSLLALLFAGCQTAPTQVTQPNRGYTQPAQPNTNTSTQWRPASDVTQSVQVTPARTSNQDSGNSDVIFKSNQIKVTKTILQQASVGGDLVYKFASRHWRTSTMSASPKQSPQACSSARPIQAPHFPEVTPAGISPA